MHYINHHKSVTVGRLLCIFCLFLPVLVFSQIAEPIQTVTTRDYGDFTLSITETLTYDSELDSLSKIYASLEPPTGILYERAIKLSNVEQYDGTSNSPVSSKAVFDQILFELKQAGLMIPEASSSQTNYAAADLPPYDRVNLELGVIEYNRRDPDDGVLDKDEYIGISVSRDTLYEGNVIFRLDSDDFRVEHQDYSKNSAIYIDFGYGFGYQRVYVDTDIIVRYQSVGYKTIRVQLDNSDPAAHNAQTQIYVASVKKLYKHVFPVQHGLTGNSATVTHLSPMTYLGQNVSTEPALYQSKKPIIFIEGFDPDSSNTASVIYYKYLNKHGLAECLLKNGYDIFIVDFNQNTDYIQNNAMVVIELLNEINNEYKITENSNIVIGASMGGLIGKYALSYMENNNIPHETSSFITIDSPHGGAYIPLGLQWLLYYLSSISAEAEPSLAMLNTPAAQQMLLIHYNILTGDYSPRTELLNDFADLGHPQKCRTIAISNGNPHGVGLDFSPGSVIFDAKMENYRWGVQMQSVEMTIRALPPNQKDLRTLVLELIIPASDAVTDRAFMSLYLAYNQINEPPYDNAPGGFGDFIDRLRINLGKIKDLEDLEVHKIEPNQCFIPTGSSLELNIDDPYFNVAGLGNDIYSHTPFDKVYFHEFSSELENVTNINLNQPHVEITKTMIGWLEQELVPEHLILDGGTHSDGEHKATKSITLKPGYHSKNADIKISGALDCSQ